MHYLAQLKTAIQREHGCEARHATSVPVRDVFQGRTLWQGTVEVFDLLGHAQAQRCFAWAHTEEHKTQAKFVTVLALPPLDSPQTAVKAALLREVQEERQARAV